MRAALIWWAPDGWHYEMTESLDAALQLEASLPYAQRLGAFPCEGSSEGALRASYWQMAEADHREIRQRQGP